MAPLAEIFVSGGGPGCAARAPLQVHRVVSEEDASPEDPGVPKKEGDG